MDSLMGSASSGERQFIKTYVLALRRDFDLFLTVREFVLAEDSLGLDVVSATKLALQLQNFYEQFAAQVETIGAKHDCKPRRVPSMLPGTEELADWFSLSFFKVMLVLQNQTALTQKKAEGWCSGKPDDWKKFFKQAAEDHHDEESAEPMSGILSKFAELLPDWNLKKPGAPNFWPFLKSTKSAWADYDNEPNDEEDYPDSYDFDFPQTD